MKNIVSVLIGVAIGVAAAYSFLSKPCTSPVAPAKAPVAAVSAKPVTPAETPAEHLKQLQLLNPSATKDPASVVRQIVHRFESLVIAGKESVFPIGEVLAEGKDLDYILNEKQAAASSLPFWNWRPGQPILSGLVLPPSFRLGLVDVLKVIAGEDAENVLVVNLTSTTRPVELAYIASVLEKIAPGKYTEVAIAAAKKLLASKNRSGTTSALDANGDSYLYKLLETSGDKSAVTDAESKLNAGGKLDFDAAKYLVATLKDQAVPELAKIYPTANAEDKNRIAMLTYNYVGASAEANQVFRDWVLNSAQDPTSQTLNARPRSLYVQMLCGGTFGPFQSEVPTNRDVINSRIGLLRDLDAATTEPRLKQAIGQSLQCLQGR